MSDIQLRGNCQYCGRLQAVNGTVAKHGYEVKNRGEGGWFSGVCSGHEYKPMQEDRAQTDATVATIRSQCAELRQLADRYEAHKAHPARVTTNRYNRETREYDTIAWEDAEPYQQKDQLRTSIFQLRHRAKIGESFAQGLEDLANAVHGTPLVEVKKEAGPEPILIGEKRIAKRGTLEAREVWRGQVHWSMPNGEKNLRGRMSTRSWRLLEKA